MTATASTTDDVVELHRDAWLRDAASAVMTLDPAGFTTGRLHVFDIGQLGGPAEGYFGFTAGAQLHELARDHLPSDDTECIAAVAVSVAAIARNGVPAMLRLSRGDDIDQIGEAVAAITGHEYAHVIDSLASDYTMPAGATLESIVASLTDGRAHAGQRSSHTAGWVRAYAHLVLRAAGRRHAGVWSGRFVLDVEAAMPLPHDAYFNALRPELFAHRLDASLLDILRTPAPAAFLALFDERDAARPATQET